MALVITALNYRYVFPLNHNRHICKSDPNINLNVDGKQKFCQLRLKIFLLFGAYADNPKISPIYVVREVIGLMKDFSGVFNLLNKF